MAKVGGNRPGAGRKQGSKNKATTEARATLTELAQTYSDDAMQVLHDVAINAKSEAARVSAATAILDRAYGRPRQQLEYFTEPAVEHEEDIDYAKMAKEIIFLFNLADDQLKKQEQGSPSLNKKV